MFAFVNNRLIIYCVITLFILDYLYYILILLTLQKHRIQ